MLLATAQHNLFVSDLTVVLVVAAITSILFRLIRQSSVLGYLLAGLIVGPYIPIPLFADPVRISEIAEFGVILVMFSVGIEFSIRRLLRLLPRSGFTAIVQMALLAWIGYSFAGLVGFDSLSQLFLGASIAISSTMVVAKVYAEYEPDRNLRDLVFGVLVIQDIVAVVLIALLTAVARGSGVTADALGSTIGGVIGALVVMIGVGLFIVPRLIRMIGHLKSREHLVVGSVALAFAIAWLAQYFGYSSALGAFLAGMLASESGRGKDIEHVITPLRDIFSAVFFVSVGMSVNLVTALDSLWISLPLAAIVILSQLIVVTGASLITGNGLRRSILAGASLGQIGEFAFIMIGVGVGAGVVAPELYPVGVTVAVVTAFTTPLIYRVASPLANVIDRHLPRQVKATLSLYESWLERLRTEGVGQATGTLLRRYLRVVLLDGLAVAGVIFGVAFFGDSLARQITEWIPVSFAVARTGIFIASFVISVPFLFGILRNARRVGAEVGKALLPVPESQSLDLGQAPRRLITVTFQLLVVIAFGLTLLAITQPLLPQFVTIPLLLVGLVVMAIYFWRTAANLGGHVRAASEVLLESLKAQTVQPANLPDLKEMLPGLSSVQSVKIPANSPAVGRTLHAIALTAKTGAAILAIHRTSGGVVSPGPEIVLQADDVVAFVGTTEAVAAARAYLLAEARQNLLNPEELVAPHIS